MDCGEPFPVEHLRYNSLVDGPVEVWLRWRWIFRQRWTRTSFPDAAWLCCGDADEHAHVGIFFVLDAFDSISVVWGWTQILHSKTLTPCARIWTEALCNLEIQQDFTACQVEMERYLIKNSYIGWRRATNWHRLGCFDGFWLFNLSKSYPELQAVSRAILRPAIVILSSDISLCFASNMHT